MKIIIVLFILTVSLSSCANMSCATYRGSKGHSLITGQKSQSVRNQTPYYKATKYAEKD